MKKLRLAVVIILGVLGLSVSGCSNTLSAVGSAFDLGVIGPIVIVEETTNFSSLLYDKTEADFTEFIVRDISIIPENSYFYIMPAIHYSDQGVKDFQDYYSDVMASYFMLNNFGTVVNTPEEADYIVMISIEESLEKFFGTNRATLSVTIQDVDETTVFYSSATAESKSDSNFYYRPSKGAKSVQYLTMKAFDKICTEGMPKAFS